MADNKMLIDATHPEETRVVVLRNGRVEEFDYESATRKLLRGNIYLAKVTRVEPALQAAFVDYGGNRHGFLAFNEIHPDYYQIPVADRQALIEEEAAAEAEEEAEADARAEALARRRARSGRHGGTARRDESGESEEASEVEVIDIETEGPSYHAEDDGAVEETAPRAVAERTSRDETVSERVETAPADDVAARGGDDESSENGASAETSGEAMGETEAAAGDVPVERGLVENEGVQEVNGGAEESIDEVGTADALEELPSRPRRSRRSYKIQEVIKRRQIILVQVVKEERGNKGAALTTYLSLAGRYTVLMPNTARGGGISRKITNPQDRKRLKAIAAELDVPEGMGLIIRTAGAARTKQEIKRDFEYLLRLWESVRDLTLQSTAPSLVYEEGNLIKRSIRDLYNKDVDEIIVAGDEAHREAKDFMRMLMPSHAKNVIEYKQPEPLFTRFGIERQLNAMFSPFVTLRSGGYLVINQTEALVAIDVNSGKSTREFSIEETALNTNLEAADEIARQLKLRDLAGLIVIDFIDMEEKRNNRAVERRMKDALRFDRARIQVGRISHFGLLEMSRQRLRTGVLEGSTSQCPHCQGTGIIRSIESVALAVLRGLEDAVMAGSRTALVATTTAPVALYILNKKRNFINDMETRHGLPILVQGSDKMQGANFTIEKGPAQAQPQRRIERTAVNMDWGFDGEEEHEAEEVEAVEPAPREERYRDEGRRDEAGEGGEGGRRRGRRRRRRGRRDEDAGEAEPRHGEAGNVEEVDTDEGAADLDEDSGAGEGPGEVRHARETADGDGEGRRGRRGRRRGRRGGRRGRDRNRDNDGRPMAAANGHDGEEGVEPFADEADVAQDETAEPTAAHQPERHPGLGEQPWPVAPRPTAAPAPVGPEPAAAPTAKPVEVAAEREEPASQPRQRTRGGEPSASEPRIERVVVKPGADEPAAEAGSDATGQPARKGWWLRRLTGSD
jgi:ribonuclease E